MRSLRFLLSRRWILFLLVVLALAYLAWLLGQWQFHRLEERRASNAVVERNEATDPVPVESVLGVGSPVADDEEWRLVRARGRYDVDGTVVVRYRTRDGAPGVDVVVPLVTEQGPALLVDRGWLATENAGSADVDVPAPPSGTVTVTGWVRADAEGSGTEVTDGSTRAVSSAEIGPTLDAEVYTGFVDLRDEDPEPARPLTHAGPPETGEGPHFFYGLQWWFFGLLAVGGFVYLAYDEWRRPGAAADRAARVRAAQGERSMPPSTGTIAPETNEDAGESRNAATRPNSSGSP